MPRNIGNSKKSQLPTAENPFDDNDDANSTDDSLFEMGNDDIDDDELRHPHLKQNGDKNNRVGEGEGEASTTPVEASWQFLGDLPYRRIVLYDSVNWGSTTPITSEENNLISNYKKSKTTDDDEKVVSQGMLSCVPPEAMAVMKSSSHFSNPRDSAQFLASTTTTLVASCPNGGPVATMTKPLSSTGVSKSFLDSTGTARIRIMTCAGRLISTVDFPPPVTAMGAEERRNHWTYTASDVLAMGFTARWMLVLVLRDSLCLTYNLSGKAVLPPFYILKESVAVISSGGRNGGGGGGGGALELMNASVYDGGVAVLSANMTTALVEFLSEVEDREYHTQCHVASRTVRSSDWNPDNDTNITNAIVPHSGNSQNYALITPLNTSSHAKANYVTYTSLSVLPRIHTVTRHPEIFLGTSDRSVLIVNVVTGEITDMCCSERLGSPVTSMSFAPNGRFLACFTSGLILTVVSVNFETKVLDFDTSDGSGEAPATLEWCGEDSVVLCWRGLGVLMVGPYGDWLRFPYYRGSGGGDVNDEEQDEVEDKNPIVVENVYIKPEMDGCRVITDQSVEILQRVPPATAALLRIGSIESGAMLLDASDAFNRGDGDQAARREITKSSSSVSVEEAIGACSNAAMREFDVPLQKRLLKAASYGMHFSYKQDSGGGSRTGDNLHYPQQKQRQVAKPSPSAIVFVQNARKLRVLNALRHASVGFVLTSSQYDSITPNGVIARLIAMKRPTLATSLSTYLDLSESVKAYARAARTAAFVAQDGNVGDGWEKTTDAACAERAMQLLTEGVRDPFVNRGGYAAVALAANKAGRKGVANLLLTLETSIWDKVPALTEIGLNSDAAAVAANARNADLIFRTLLNFEKVCINATPDASKAQTNYLNSVVTKFPPEAVNLLSSYFGSMQDVKHIMNLQLRGQKYVAAGSIIAKRALSSTTERERLRLLQEASRIFTTGRDKAQFQKSCTDDYLELINEQERLRHIYGPDIAPKTSSVTETIFNVIYHASVNKRETRKLLLEGEKLAKKFKVPEKRLWHVKVRAFAGSSQWGNLHALAESRAKAPIGFKHFAVVVIKGKQSVGEIIRYVDKVTNQEERYDLYCEASLWKRAVDVAINMGDVRRVLHVRSLCNAPEIQRMCDKFASASKV